MLNHVRGCQPVISAAASSHAFISSIFNVPHSLLTISRTKHHHRKTFPCNWMLSCRIHVCKDSPVSPMNSLVSERCVRLLSARAEVQLHGNHNICRISQQLSTCRPWLAWLWSFLISGMRNVHLLVVLSLHP